jgi:predicted alpha-1,2-mannosidase
MMNRKSLHFLALIFVVLLSTCDKGVNHTTPADYVNPFIGTAGHGHTYPGAMVPFGMVQLSPDTRKDNWDACSGYHYSDDKIYGFSHTHLSGTGVGDYGDIRLMPYMGSKDKLLKIYQEGDLPYAAFSHDNEEATAGYYEVEFENIDVRLTAGRRSGFHHYTFSGSQDRFVLVDLFEGATTDRILGLELNIVDSISLSGLKRTSGWAADQYVYFHAVFSRPFNDITVLENGQQLEGKTFSSMKDLKAILSFDGETDEVFVKVGISAVDAEGARKNLEADIPEWDFDRRRKDAKASWNEELGRIEVHGGTEAQKITFYTALYHAYLAPYLYSDVDGRYRGHDLEVHTTRDHDIYTVFSLWDTFRALHPLFTITQQERTTALIKTMLDIYDKGGLLPVWELAANETWCMIGYHAVPVIADAYFKGIRNYDVQKAFKAMKKSSLQDFHGLKYYKKYGFIPADKEGESVSKTLEYAYDDWCIARMANDLGYEDDYLHYSKRAQYYKNIFDSSTGFMRGRMNGMWVSPFNPVEVNFMLTEANTWQYNFFVPQDINGLMRMLGGAGAFCDKLDEMFNAPAEMSGRQQSDITGLIGQYAHGNEPSHHMAYLYNFCGQAWKTQDLVRRIMSEQYNERPDGLCGNEDCGQMSAWYVLSAMGFYPVTPGTDYYVIGSPLFDKVSIKLENGKTCVIEAKNNSDENKYIQSASIDSKLLTRSYLLHEEIMAGSHLVFEMGPQPALDWGTGEGNIPVTAIEEPLITTAPYIMADSRTFSKNIEIGMACYDPAAVIYFTLDGSDPDTGSRVYTESFTLEKNTTIKLFAAAPGKVPSKVVSGTFSKMPAGRKVVYAKAYDSQYTAGGDIALIDLIRGSDNFRTGSWQGFQGVDVDITLDLGEMQNVDLIKAGFLQDQKSWIFMPEYVEFYVSDDGDDFQSLGRENNLIDARQGGGMVHDFSAMARNRDIRFIRIYAKNRAVCPEWHPGAGNPAWLFIDEVVIE